MSRNRGVFLIGVVGLLLLFAVQFISSYDRKLHIVFCDVGQGDGVYIRTPSGKEILLDGGPDDSVVACLDAHRPFWDRSFDFMVLSHPHYDHFRGLIDVLSRYRVDMILQEPLVHNSDAYNIFSKAVVNERADIRKVGKGTKLSFPDGVTLSILGPDSKFIEQENPLGIIGNDNPPSLIMHLQYHTVDVLLTGDSDGEDLEKFVPAGLNPEILLLPHHGSRNGYTAQAAGHIKPKIAVISAGKNNSYGHPHQEVVRILEKYKAQILRTDIGGHIHLIIDSSGKITIASGLP